MRRGLIIYGDPATGKSTLELNLREYIVGHALSTRDFSTSDKICFLGKTANPRTGNLMSTGGAEAMLKLPDLPVVDWYVASLPTRGRPGVQVSTDFLRTLDDLQVIGLYSDHRQTYLNKRTKFFSHRDTRNKVGPSKPKRPSYIPEENCKYFRTEELQQAFLYALNILGNPPRVLTSTEFKLLEAFALPI